MRPEVKSWLESKINSTGFSEGLIVDALLASMASMTNQELLNLALKRKEHNVNRQPRV